MRAPKIRVENGRINLDEPTSLPDVTVIYLVPAEQLEDVAEAEHDLTTLPESGELWRIPPPAHDPSLATRERPWP